MVKVNISQLVTVEVLQFVINDKTLHFLFSFTHVGLLSGSRHRHQVFFMCIHQIVKYDNGAY